MIPDRHTACLACPVQVRTLYEAANIVAVYLETLSALPAELEEPTEMLAAALAAVRPFIEAHRENQDHALSPELLPARLPLLTA